MVTRGFNIVAGASSVTFGLLLLAWAAAGDIDPRVRHVSLSSDFHMSLARRDADARLVLFNDLTYGPYTGSIAGIAGDPVGPTVSGFGGEAGLYYRDVRWPGGLSLWTLSVSLLYPMALAAILPTAWLVRRVRRPRRGFPVGRERISTGFTESASHA